MLLGQHPFVFRRTRRHAHKQACSHVNCAEANNDCRSRHRWVQAPQFWCSLSIQIHRRASASCTHTEVRGGRRSDRSARKTYKTFRKQSRCKHRGRKPTEIDFRRPSLLRNPNRSPNTPSRNSGTPSTEAVSAGEHATPSYQSKTGAFRPKPNRQRPRALQRRKRRLRENLDWVKLEHAANREPPRHQRQRGTEAPNRATAAPTQEPTPSEEAHPRTTEADRETSRTPHIRRHVILDANSKLLVQGTNADRSRRLVAKVRVLGGRRSDHAWRPRPPDTECYNAPSRMRVRRWDCYLAIATADAHRLSRKREIKYAGWLAIP